MTFEEAPSPRKAVSLLRDAPDRLELLLRWCSEKEASRAVGEAGSIRSVVGRLGTLDRHHYLESVRRIASRTGPAELPGLEPPAGTGEADLADCELPELVTRFRHLRAQSAEFLEGLAEEAWSRSGADPALGELTVAGIVTHWVSHDATALSSLSAMCAGLQKC